MKVGDLINWYSDSLRGDDGEPVQDIGIITGFSTNTNRFSNGEVYITWVTGDGNGWYDVCHPSIGVISYASATRRKNQ